MTLWTSLSFRLAMLYGALLSLSVAVIGGAFYGISIRIPLEQAERLVRQEADDLADTYIVEGRAALVTKLEARARIVSVRQPFHALIDANGSVITANYPTWPREVAAEWTRIDADLYRDGDENDHEALSLDRVFDDGTRLLVGRDIEDVDDREEALRQVAGTVIALSILLSLTGGVLMSRVIGSRLEAMSSAARRVIEGDLRGRIPLRGGRDDFDRLAATLNAMLDRIELLVGSVHRVSDNVAHELRTPLARIRGDLEALRSAGEGSRADLLDQVTDEAEQLERLFDAVLRIARIEGDRHSFTPQSLDLSQLVHDAAELYEPLAEAKHQRLTTDIAPDLRLEGDRDLLFQAVCNLIDNAVKFAPAAGTVHVAAVDRGDAIILEISDDGPGIAPDHRQRVTERFYRIGTTADAPGAGLGLTFVSAVIRLHRAYLLIGSPPQGAKISIYFRH